MNSLTKVLTISNNLVSLQALLKDKVLFTSLASNFVSSVEYEQSWGFMFFFFLFHLLKLHLRTNDSFTTFVYFFLLCFFITTHNLFFFLL